LTAPWRSITLYRNISVPAPSPAPTKSMKLLPAVAVPMLGVLSMPVSYFALRPLRDRLTEAMAARSVARRTTKENLRTRCARIRSRKRCTPGMFQAGTLRCTYFSTKFTSAPFGAGSRSHGVLGPSSTRDPAPFGWGRFRTGSPQADATIRRLRINASPRSDLISLSASRRPPPERRVERPKCNHSARGIGMGPVTQRGHQGWGYRPEPGVRRGHNVAG